MILGVDGRELRPGLHTGIGRYLRGVVAAAAARGWSCFVYGEAAAQLPETWPGVCLRPLAAPWQLWWDQVALPRALRRDRARVFLSPYYKAPLLAPCPVVVTIHDLFFIGYPGRPRPVYDAVAIRLARLYARRARAIVADSEHGKRAVVSRLGVSPAKVRVVPVALGREFGPATLSPAARARYGLVGPYVLYVGNFKPHKNLPRLLDAWARLHGSLRAGHRLALAGGDDPGALRALATRLGLDGTVIFTGPVEARDLPGLYGDSVALVLPSLEEGFGLPALEAMACGAPVVATDRGAVPEVVGDAAVLVDPEKETAIAEALAVVLGSPQHRVDLRRRGLARAQLFTPARTAEKVLDLLEEVAR